MSRVDKTWLLKNNLPGTGHGTCCRKNAGGSRWSRPIKEIMRVDEIMARACESRTDIGTKFPQLNTEVTTNMTFKHTPSIKSWLTVCSCHVHGIFICHKPHFNCLQGDWNTFVTWSPSGSLTHSANITMQPAIRYSKYKQTISTRSQLNGGITSWLHSYPFNYADLFIVNENSSDERAATSHLQITDWILHWTQCSIDRESGNKYCCSGNAFY